MENLYQWFKLKTLKNAYRKRSVPSSPALVLAANTLVCSLVALVLQLIMNEHGQTSYWTVWIYSMCIGQTLCIMLMVWSRLMRHQNRSVVFRLISFSGVVVVGFLFGNTLGSVINGHPLDFSPTESTFRNSFVVALLIAVGSVWYYGTRARLATLELQASEAQLSMLRAQIEPHMLFNTLANLRVLIGKNPRDAQVLLDQLIEFLRATLDGSRSTEGTVGDEFNILDSYLSLLKVRFGDRLGYQLQLPPALANHRVPALLLQPLVENAVKHGIEPAADGGHLDVIAEQVNDDLVLSVKNTGPSMGSTASSETGFGVVSVRERLKETYGPAASIHFISPLKGQSVGTLVTLRIPITNA